MKDTELDKCFITHERLMEKFTFRMNEYKLDRTPETKRRALKALDELRGSHKKISKRLSDMIAANERIGGSNIKRKIGS